MSVNALYAGTFDPFTNGHYDIVKRGLDLFDSLTVVVAVPPSKTPFIAPEKRVEMIKSICGDHPKIKVVSWSRLIVDYARENNIQAIIRGLRPTGDFESEFQMATMNRQLNHDVETIFIATNEHNYYVSSSLVKEIWRHGGDIKNFVPRVVFDELMNMRDKND